MNSERTEDNRRGRHAESPGKIPLKGWKNILLRVKENLGKDHLSIISAGVAFYAMLAIFPGLTALVSLYGLVSDPMGVQDQLAALRHLIPPEAYTILETQLRNIAEQPGGSLSFGFIGGLLITLWSANKGVKTLMEALNIVYEEKESRGFIRKNLLSLFFTFLVISFIVLTLIAIVVAPALLKFLPLPVSTQKLFTYMQWPFLALMVILLLNFTYGYFPNRRRPKWRWVTSGSLFAGIFWILASALFSFYVVNFGNYNKMYGSVGAVIVLMMWFYLSSFIILLGGELNSEVEHQTARDSTKWESRPMGERDAYVADHLGEAKE
ncbi:MAG: YihY/virulence factor BrkB family protein [Desulfobulbaceae bacterium]|nr:YihY/virulence factor BrkB family protein [Desulfobulbaceae bacterium]